jgi:putative acetyltransferase
MNIRDETPQDFEAIREVHRLAFGRDAEARLVDRLRGEARAVVSLVAEEGETIAGHILFSDLVIESEGGWIHAAALAPVAVRHEWQRRGIGSALVKRGLTAARERGQTIAIVLGNPAFYTRFGFSVKKARHLSSPFPSDSLLAIELVHGALEGVRGTVRYPEAFT